MSETSRAPMLFDILNEVGIIAQLSGTAFQRLLPEGLSVAGFTVLNHFVRLQKVAESPARLARAFQISKAAMTNTLQRLEAMDLVTIEANPGDGRGKLVRLTIRGRIVREDAILRLAPALEALDEALAEVPLERPLAFLRQLRMVLDAARD